MTKEIEVKVLAVDMLQTVNKSATKVLCNAGRNPDTLLFKHQTKA